jgi:hypothetical protein
VEASGITPRFDSGGLIHFLAPLSRLQFEHRHHNPFRFCQFYHPENQRQHRIRSANRVVARACGRSCWFPKCKRYSPPKYLVEKNAL